MSPAPLQRDTGMKPADSSSPDHPVEPSHCEFSPASTQGTIAPNVSLLKLL